MYMILVQEQCFKDEGRVKIEVLRCLATAKSALTSFSPSPSHLLVRLLELILIRLLLASAASARASNVFPLP